MTRDTSEAPRAGDYGAVEPDCERIADRLSQAGLEIEKIDYNALTPDELRQLLATRGVLLSLAVRYRRQQDGEGSPGTGGES